VPPGPHLASIQIHPIKALDPVVVNEARIGPGGGLDGDRVWALFTANGDVVNGKRTARIHQIRSTFTNDRSTVRLTAPGMPAADISFPDDTELAGAWFSDYFNEPIAVRYVPEGLPDDTDRNGPMVISSATLRTVTVWFPEINLDEARRRFRAPLEVGGVQPFWEDGLFGDIEAHSVLFRVGGVTFSGTNPCPRCPVASRNPDSGAATVGFQKRFSELREAQLPVNTVRERFAHFYYLGINTRVAASEIGKTLRVGDPVALEANTAT